jgi:hypothetical protein
MAAIINEIGAIEKDKRNKQQGFQYRGIDDVYAALHPLLAKNNVVILPSVKDLQRSERQTKSGASMMMTTVIVEYRFMADDGTSVSCTMAGEGMDMADKSTAKAMAVAQKYAVLQTFCVPVQELVDGDSETPEASEPKPPVTRQPSQFERERLSEAASKGTDAFRDAWTKIQHMQNCKLKVTDEEAAVWRETAKLADESTEMLQEDMPV